MHATHVQKVDIPWVTLGSPQNSKIPITSMEKRKRQVMVFPCRNGMLRERGIQEASTVTTGSPSKAALLF